MLPTSIQDLQMRMNPNSGRPLPLIFCGDPQDWVRYARNRCLEIVDELQIRDYILPRRMPNGDERPLSEVRTSDLESAAFINARFSLSVEGLKEQVKLQTGEV